MPVTLVSGFGALSVFAGCFIASAGGIGGGGVLVSIYLVLYGFSYNRSTVLSLVTVMGNLFSQLSLNYKKPHHILSSRPLIYWDAIVILAPAQLGGSSIGKIVAEILPDIIKKSLAILVLAIVFVKTYYKARIFYRTESEQAASELESGNDRMVSVEKITEEFKRLVSKDEDRGSMQWNVDMLRVATDIEYQEIVGVVSVKYEGQNNQAVSAVVEDDRHPASALQQKEKLEEDFGIGATLGAPLLENGESKENLQFPWLAIGCVQFIMIQNIYMFVAHFFLLFNTSTLA